MYLPKTTSFVLRLPIKVEVYASQHTWRITLLLSLVISGIILGIQFPWLFYSHDVSFHTAKILRSSTGHFFIDPFTGAPTIYPSLFHFCFGHVKRFLDLDSVQIVRLITLVDFIGLFAAFYYFARAFFNDAEQASFCVLSLSLVFYAPSGRYILLPEPGNFSFVFLLFGIGALYRYLMGRKLIYLILGGLSSSLAVNIWWSNVFSVVPILLLVSYYIVVRRPLPKLSHVCIFIIALLLPCLYTAWQIYSIWDIFPNYFTQNSKGGLQIEERVGHKPGNFGSMGTLIYWIITFLTMGNVQFRQRFYFWDFSDGALLYSLASIFHYFFLVLPFNLLLIFYVFCTLLWKNQLNHTSANLLRTLPIGGLLVLFSSIATLSYAGVAHTRRVQFIIYPMLLVCAYASIRSAVSYERQKKLRMWVTAAAILSLAWTVAYSSLLPQKRMSEADEEIVRFLNSRPNHADERIFMLSVGLRRVAPFVLFKSFVETKEGLYYWQDPISASNMYSDFITIKQKKEDWLNVVRERKIRLFIFRIADATESVIFRQYQNDGSIVLRNSEWAVLKLNV